LPDGEDDLFILILMPLNINRMPILFISENILSLICGLGILQGILLAALLYFHPKSDRSVNTFLALYIFCISIESGNV
jgi:hypothetical protein